MRHSDNARRGAPLVMLGTVIGTWAIYRAMVWQPPIFENGLPEELGLPFGGTALAAAPANGGPVPFPSKETRAQWEGVEVSRGQVLDPTRVFAQTSVRGNMPNYATPTLRPTDPAPSRAVLPHWREPAMPSPGTLAAQATTSDGDTQEAAIGAPNPASRQSRWSGEAWTFLRDGGTSTSAALRPSYGRSQAGATIRYDLAPASAARQQLYSRASVALEGGREREAAIGASIRPVAAIPVRLHGEGRLFDSSFGSEVRAAIFATTELPAANVPDDWRIETYLQAGYVTGDFATPFADGQVRISRTLLARADVRIDAGAGSWGGAQKGTERLDVGPTVAITVPIGEVVTRLSADYRFRVAGEAEPSSGPALTLSAGF